MERLRGLDLLRSIAILWVMLFQAWAAGLGLPMVAIAKFGWMGVDLFFALSGYLIGSQVFKIYAQGKKLSLKEFYLRRGFRILPLYWTVVALYFTVPNFREAPGIDDMWQFLTFTENLLINYQNNRAFSHAWSLCIEEHFYLLFPLIVMLMMKKPSIKKTIFLCLSLLTLGIVIRAYLWIFQLYPYKREGQEVLSFGVRYFELIYFPTYCRLDGILAGVAVAGLRYFRPTWWELCMKKGNTVFAIGLSAFLVSIWMFQVRQSFIACVFGYPLLSIGCAILVASAVSPKSILGSIKVPFVGTLATLSYSLYLVHKQIFHLTKDYLNELVAGGGYVALFVYFALACLGASVLYAVIERPFLKLREKL